MTDNEINRAVAEELRYYYIDGTDEGCIKSQGEPMQDIPNFCYDYNAAAEMRRAIKPEEVGEFIHTLSLRLKNICGTTYYVHVWEFVTATPCQQAEAFLRLRGKWKEVEK
jgi:hypothetical protein